MMRIDPPQLEALVAVVDHGTMSAAARALHLTQPALSRRIAALELTVGLNLFHRIDRATRLTSDGAAILPYARRVLGDAADIATVVEALRGNHQGTLHVVGLPSLVATVLPPIAAAYHRRYPHIAMRLSGAVDTDAVASMVSNADCDLAISDLDVTYTGLETVALGATRMLAVTAAPGATRDSDVEKLTRSDLDGRTLVTLPVGTLTRRLTDEFYADLEAAPSHVVTTTQRDALIPLAVSGIGVTFVPEPLALAAGPGVRLARPSTPHRRHFGLVHRPGIAAPAVAGFLEVARTSAGVRV